MVLVVVYATIVGEASNVSAGGWYADADTNNVVMNAITQLLAIYVMAMH